jgi:hypothetical protein
MPVNHQPRVSTHGNTYTFENDSAHHLWGYAMMGALIHLACYVYSTGRFQEFGMPFYSTPLCGIDRPLSHFLPKVLPVRVVYGFGYVRIELVQVSRIVRTRIPDILTPCCPS